MRIVAIEVRDRATFLACAVIYPTATCIADSYLLRRTGFESSKQVILMRLDDQKAHSDPFAWGGRTFPVIHHHLIQMAYNGKYANPGDVFDVEFILGETKEPKISERLEHPL